MEPENEAIDGEGVAREWLKGCAGVAALVGTRVYFGLPRKTTPTYPCIEVVRVGGGPDGQGRDRVEIGVTTYGLTSHDASAVALEVCRYLQAEEYYPNIVESAYFVEAGGQRTFTRIPNLGNDVRRYSVTGWLLVRKV